MNHSVRAPALDISISLLRQIQNDINSGNIIGSAYNHKNSDLSLLERIYRIIGFGTGKIQVYRLSEQTEQLVREYYNPFLSQFKEQPKIRLKSFQNVNWVPIHSDMARSPNGDCSSITIGVKTNGETTHHYDYLDQNVFEISFANRLKCKHSHATNFEDTHEYVLDNRGPHSVDGFHYGSHRYLLALSWNNIDYNSLVEIYNDYSNRTSHT